MIEVPFLFAALGFIIILGFLGNLFFRKTRVPDTFWLLLLGLILGPIFHVIDTSVFVEYTPYFAALALVVILFEGGLRTDFYTLIRESPVSFLLAAGNVVLSMLVVAPIMQNFFGWPTIYGLLLGAMIGGSSSPIVISVTESMKLEEKIKTILNLESTITDVLCVVLSIGIVQTIIFGNSSLSLTLNRVFGTFSIGIVVGFISGVMWLIILKKMKGKPFEYILTLGVLFIVYAFIEKIMGSGAIGALIFGIVLGNAREISKILKMKDRIAPIGWTIKKLHREISFLIRSFFFVYLGLLVTISDINLIFIGIGITTVLFLLRILIVRASTIPLSIDSYHKNILSVVMPRGLAAAVLAQLPATYNLPFADMFTNLIFVVITTSILIFTLGLVLVKR
jgi:cell volume regulation protein A